MQGLPQKQGDPLNSLMILGDQVNISNHNIYQFLQSEEFETPTDTSEIDHYIKEMFKFKLNNIYTNDKYFHLMLIGESTATVQDDVLWVVGPSMQITKDNFTFATKAQWTLFQCQLSPTMGNIVWSPDGASWVINIMKGSGINIFMILLKEIHLFIYLYLLG